MIKVKQSFKHTLSKRNESCHNMLFLNLDHVIACDGNNIEKAAIDIERGFHLLDGKNIFQPFKTTLKSLKHRESKQEGLVNFLPAYINDELSQEIYGCKALGAMPSNVESGIPRATGVIILFDPDTKCPVCLMDAQVISATRTGAVTYLAMQKLANHNTSEVGLVGAGVNMRTQLMALSKCLKNLKRCYVYSRGKSKFEFAIDMEIKTGLEIIPVDSAEKAVRDKELVVTCLPNILSPVVKAEWVKDEGVTCINIGCYEYESSLLTRMDRIVADIWEQGKHRGVQTHAQAVKEGKINESRIEDLAPIITGRAACRQNPDENIFFVPTGLGFEDLMVAWRVYQCAKENHIGTPMPLWNKTRWWK